MGSKSDSQAYWAKKYGAARELYNTLQPQLEPFKDVSLTLSPELKVRNKTWLRSKSRKEDDSVERKSPTITSPEAYTSNPKLVSYSASSSNRQSTQLSEVASLKKYPRDFARADLDIIAIHELKGTPITSWPSNEFGTMWLRDLLQKEFPNARVMSYEYSVPTEMVGNPRILEYLAIEMIDTILRSRPMNSCIKKVVRATCKLSTARCLFQRLMKFSVQSFLLLIASVA